MTPPGSPLPPAAAAPPSAPTKPLFMWAGGKTKMLKHYTALLPTRVDHYIEPFFGGGAMFLEVMRRFKPAKVSINDVNGDIINIYTQVRDDLPGFLAHLQQLDTAYIGKTKEERKVYYYEVRTAHAFDYAPWSASQRAATLYFLMRTGFNGIYQLNQNTNGRYGTPAGLLNHKGSCFDRANVTAWHRLLAGTEITATDWAQLTYPDTPGTFIFLDPPYRDSFTQYGVTFNDAEHEKLLRFTERFKQARVFLCNREVDDTFFADHQGTLLLDKFPVTYTAGRRKATADGFAAKKATELLFRNR